MQRTATDSDAGEITQRWVKDLFTEQQQAIFKRTDRMFAVLMVVQWAAGIAAALWISPQTWAGQYSQTHIHVWAAVILGGAISLFPIMLAVTRSGHTSTRYVIAIAQMLMSALLIHLTGGRIETHFHVFGSLAFLSFYRDWRVLVPATVVVAADHVLRGIFWPQSVYGVLAASNWRGLEHASWVLFENTFLFLAIRHNVSDMWNNSERMAEIKSLNQGLERHSAQLAISNRELKGEITERKRVEAERQVISEIIQGLNTTADLDELLRIIHQSIGKVLCAENCFVALCEKGTDMIHMQFFEDKYDPPPPPLKLSTNRTSYVFRTGRPVLMTAEVFRRLAEQGEVEPAGAPPAIWLGVPLKTPTETIGVLAVQHYEDESAYSERDLELLSSVGSQIALAIERKQAEAALRQSEEQLRQAQKMEGIGQLAGGVAHDFNNLLTAITGYSELTLRRLPQDNPLRRNVEEIKKAGERAASLTRQLLAFSRKQMLQPKVLDLNAVVADIDSMLRRLIGEDIDLLTVLDEALGSAKADPGQIEQVIMNLAVNARDAMPQGGKLTIETANVYLGEEYTRHHVSALPGHYVMLAVSDNGCGMDKATQSRIFEPFFTTKEVGKGTGLGLSTVYGIVKQSGGNIWVYSEVGKGTTFKVYLPRFDEVVEGYEESTPAARLSRGGEMVLLVEDEEMVRQIARQILEVNGYEVLEASHGKEALLISEEHEGRIDLMVTDVVMPQMSGRELAECLASSRPETKVLYTSGYTDDAIVRHGVLDENMNFLQKPFTPDALAHKVREVLSMHLS